MCSNYMPTTRSWFTPTRSHRKSLPHTRRTRFNVLQRSMHQFEIVRLCALWDGAEIDKENIATVVELIDSAPIIDALADQMRRHWADRGPARLLNPSEDPEEAAIVEGNTKLSSANSKGSRPRPDLSKQLPPLVRSSRPNASRRC